MAPYTSNLFLSIVEADFHHCNYMKVNIIKNEDKQHYIWLTWWDTRVCDLQILGCSTTWVPKDAVSGSQLTTSAVVTIPSYFVVRTTSTTWKCANCTTRTNTSWGSPVHCAFDLDHSTSWTWYGCCTVFAHYFPVCSAWEWTVLVSSYMIIQTSNIFSHLMD